VGGASPGSEDVLGEKDGVSSFSLFRLVEVGGVGILSRWFCIMEETRPMYNSKEGKE
jgi:hypothetical protein